MNLIMVSARSVYVVLFRLFNFVFLDLKSFVLILSPFLIIKKVRRKPCKEEDRRLKTPYLHCKCEKLHEIVGPGPLPSSTVRSSGPGRVPVLRRMTV